MKYIIVRYDGTVRNLLGDVIQFQAMGKTAWMLFGLIHGSLILSI